jgi:hypothetical protein
MRKIEYKSGEIIGDYGISYLQESKKHLFPSGEYKRTAYFLCTCGNRFHALISNIKYNAVMSCGCRGEYYVKHGQKTHGLSKHPLHRRWREIKTRCYNVNDAGYKNYGGRGITMCDEWRNDFKAFYDYVSKLPHYGEKGMTIDRIYNDGNYEPGNVQWATMQQQNMNKRNSRKNTTK